MSTDKKRLYGLSIAILAALLAVLLLPRGNSRVITAFLIVPITIAICLLVKKRSLLSVNKKEILLISTMIGIISVVLTQLTGLYFDFYKNPYFVNLDILLTFVLPFTVIIVMTEIVRAVLLAQNEKTINVIAFVFCVLVEALMYSNLAGITSFNRFMDFVGLTLFPAISANIYYHYVSKRYGVLPNIAFRLITTLYIYFIPTVTGMTDALSSCIKIILPIILLAFISSLFEKKKKSAVRKGKKIGGVATTLTVVVIVSVAMLISCQFRFGALVIATDSMTGEINKGDMIIYERYDGQQIKEGQVIVFLQNESKIVHRVVKIENIGGELRYYTKGDANEDLDSGYRGRADIVGLTDVKVTAIGYPTLWLRELIEN